MDGSDAILSASEIIKDRLYFVTFKTTSKPKNTVNSQYFCTDELFVYESFYWDFGPLNICHVYNYCDLVSTKLSAKALGRKKIIHYTSATPQKRLNAAFLVGAYAIIELNKSAAEAYTMLMRGDPPPFMKFRDASNITPVFEISLQDCLAAVEKAMKFNFFDFSDFNSCEYEYYERVENGDLNWILPGKFLAMCGPHRVAGIVKGYPQHAPESYFDYFRKNDVKHIVRLNCKSYDAKQFTDNGFKHLEMFFPDGSCPNDAIMQQFLQYCEQTGHAIAVHCKAGLGRTGSLIGAYMVKHYRFSALEAIAWLRLCRPGSVIGHQQRWLMDRQEQLWSEGERFRKRHGLNVPPRSLNGIYGYRRQSLAGGALKDKLGGISNQVNNINLNDESSSSLDAVNNNNNNNEFIECVDEEEGEDDDDEELVASPQDELDDARNNNNIGSSRGGNTSEGGSRRSNSPPRPPQRLKSARAQTMAATLISGKGSSSVKTQGDELNEIKAGRLGRRHTRSHNLEHSNLSPIDPATTTTTSTTTTGMQRFAAKITTTKGKEAAVSGSHAVVAAASGGVVVGTHAPTYLRRNRLLKMIGGGGEKGTSSSASSMTSTSTGSSSAGSANVIAKNLRNAVNLLDSANNNTGTGGSSVALNNKQRNKRSIHERENNTGASKISRRYASTTMAVQQKQKEPVHTTTLVVKKVTITPATTNSKTYPGPKRSAAYQER